MENVFEQFNPFGNSAMDSAKELEAINVKLFEKLTAKNMELFNSGVALNNKFIALMGQPAGMQDMLNEQVKLGGEFNGKLISTVKEAAEIVVDAQQDYKDWMQQGFQAASPVAAKKPATRKKAA